MNDLETGSQPGDRVAQKASETAAKGVGKVARKGGEVVGKAAAKAGKAAVKLVAKGIFTLIGPWGVVALIAIIAILGIFFGIESVKASAFTDWSSFAKDYCKISDNYKSKGYTTMAGLTQGEFDKFVKFPDGYLFTGQMPIKDGLTSEEKEKLEQENKQRQANFNEESTLEERYRMVAYLTAERISILKKEDDRSFWQKIFGSGQSTDTPGVAILDKDGKKFNIAYDGDNIKTFVDYIEINNNGAKSKQKIEAGNEIFKRLEGYALSWKVLYLIDKALDENEFENFEEIKNFTGTEDEKKKLIEELKKKFITAAIPQMQSKIKVVRHYKEVVVTTVSVDAEGKTSTTVVTTKTPIYMIEKVHMWNKDIDTPTIMVTKETTTRGSNSTTTTTRITEPVAGQGTYTDISKDLKDKILKEIYGERNMPIISYDVEHALYAAGYSPDFQAARYDIAHAFGIQLQDNGSGGVGGNTADITKLVQRYPSSTTVKVISNIIDYINSKCSAAGIPAPAVIAQALKESGYNLDNESCSGVDHNLFGIGKAYNGKDANGNGWADFSSYEECIDEYVNIITKEYPYAIVDASMGGYEEYLHALEFPPTGIDPGHKWCTSGDPQSYVDDIISTIRANELFSTSNEGGTINGVPLYNQSDPKWKEGDSDFSYGSIAGSGCAVTSCAMIISFYSGQRVTPVDVVRANSGEDGAQRVTITMANKYNLSYNIDRNSSSNTLIEKAKSALAAGNPVMVHQDVGSKGRVGGTHYIVLTKATNEGFMFNDPAGGIATSKNFEFFQQHMDEIYWYERK
jgi:flagellum-specific peptidoglycan hydrolase FlgJ